MKKSWKTHLFLLTDYRHYLHKVMHMQLQHKLIKWSEIHKKYPQSFFSNKYLNFSHQNFSCHFTDNKFGFGLKNWGLFILLGAFELWYIFTELPGLL